MTRRDDSGAGRASSRGQEEARSSVHALSRSKPAALEPLDFLGDSPLVGEAQEALVRARAATLIEDLYDARGRLLKAREALAAERERERARLLSQAEIFLRSVTSAREQGARVPAPGEDAAGLRKEGADPYAAFLDKAKAELARARDGLDARGVQEEAFFAAEIARVSDELAGRVRALLDRHAPRVAFSIQPVGSAHAVAWMERPSPDDAVLITFLLSGHLPTRYGALFDDAIDALDLAPATFFAEEGFAARPATLDEADALCLSEGRLFVPFKAMIPFRLPDLDFPRLRFVNQGPLLQLVAREVGEDYAPLMPIATAEAVAGRLIRLQVEGAIALEFKAM